MKPGWDGVRIDEFERSPIFGKFRRVCRNLYGDVCRTIDDRPSALLYTVSATPPELDLHASRCLTETAIATPNANGCQGVVWRAVIDVFSAIDRAWLDRA